MFRLGASLETALDFAMDLFAEATGNLVYSGGIELRPDQRIHIGFQRTAKSFAYRCGNYFQRFDRVLGVDVVIVGRVVCGANKRSPQKRGQKQNPHCTERDAMRAPESKLLISGQKLGGHVCPGFTPVALPLP